MTAIEWPALQPTTSAALALVLRHGPLGRAEMARQLGVSRANLTRVTRELLAAGLVAGGTSELRGETGRPSELLRLVPDAYHFAGVKLTADRLYAVVVNLAGRTVAYRDLSLRSRDVDAVLDRIADILTDPDWQGYRIAGAGVSLAGTIQGMPGNERVRESVYLGWDDIPLAERATSRLGLPVSVENDVQALTLAESMEPASASEASLALVTIGVGIGVGFLSHGDLLRGAHGRPGRFSHLLVDTTGPHCDQEHRGCVAAYLTSASIARNAGASSYEEALSAARRGEAQAVAALEAAGRALGVLIATVTNVFDPDRVILTGDGLELSALVPSAVQTGIRTALAWDAGPVTLDVRPFDFSEWARAAAVMAIHAALTSGRAGR